MTHQGLLLVGDQPTPAASEQRFLRAITRRFQKQGPSQHLQPWVTLWVWCTDALKFEIGQTSSISDGLPCRHEITTVLKKLVLHLIIEYDKKLLSNTSNRQPIGVHIVRLLPVKLYMW